MILILLDDGPQAQETLPSMVETVRLFYGIKCASHKKRKSWFLESNSGRVSWILFCRVSLKWSLNRDRLTISRARRNIFHRNSLLISHTRPCYHHWFAHPTPPQHTHCSPTFPTYRYFSIVILLLHHKFSTLPLLIFSLFTNYRVFLHFFIWQIILLYFFLSFNVIT